MNDYQAAPRLTAKNEAKLESMKRKWRALNEQRQSVEREIDKIETEMNVLRVTGTIRRGK
jgi:peptidoglycan hydrolase CwlO-like protein